MALVSNPKDAAAKAALQFNEWELMRALEVLPGRLASRAAAMGEQNAAYISAIDGVMGHLEADIRGVPSNEMLGQINWKMRDVLSAGDNAFLTDPYFGEAAQEMEEYRNDAYVEEMTSDTIEAPPETPETTAESPAPEAQAGAAEASAEETAAENQNDPPPQEQTADNDSGSSLLTTIAGVAAMAGLARLGSKIGAPGKKTTAASAKPTTALTRGGYAAAKSTRHQKAASLAAPTVAKSQPAKNPGYKPAPTAKAAGGKTVGNFANFTRKPKNPRGGNGGPGLMG